MPSPCKLPPLILHPFSNSSGPAKLVDASRASLALQGLLPGQDNAEELERRLLEGRYCEITMLFYLGKDLVRWADQCADMVGRCGQNGHGLRSESFADLLVEDPPPEVLAKLQSWGVHEHRSIFSRALGLHALFELLPGCEHFSPDFVRYYHRFADHMFVCHRQLVQYQRINSADFSFQLFASGEYTKMLETEWGAP